MTHLDLSPYEFDLVMRAGETAKIVLAVIRHLGITKAEAEAFNGSLSDLIVDKIEGLKARGSDREELL